MTIELHNLTFDCADAPRLGTFWANLLGWNVFLDDDPEVYVAPTLPHHGGPGLLFIPVPESKSAKNRIHFDVAPTDCTRDEQVEKAIGLGATVLGDHRNADGTGWVVMADPEGNEFCIERSQAERAPATTSVIRVDYLHD
ncbi:MAG: VOC family protein [Nocardioides sp.]